MGEQEDKEKAEKLAAAKKRVAALKKKKQGATGASKAKDTKKDDVVEIGTRDVPEGIAEAAQQSEEGTSKPKEEPTSVDEAVDDDEAAFNKAIKGATSVEDVVDDAELVKSPESSEPPFDTISNPKARSDAHARQPSLSIQSKLRSTSFRRDSKEPVGLPPSPHLSTSTTAILPPLTPDGETIQEIYRKQVLRLEELERENKRLDREAREGETRWRKNEEELEELRESSPDTGAIRAQAQKANDAEAEILRLQEEIRSLQRRANESARGSHRNARAGSISILQSASPDGGMKQELAAKEVTIGDMELEISKLRGQLSKQSEGCSTHGEQIAALQKSFSITETKTRKLEQELSDSRRAIDRASERSVREGVERTSKDTKLMQLERDLADANARADETAKKAAQLEKKIDAMNKLHRESEGRQANKLSAAEKENRDIMTLKAKLAASENESLKAKDELSRLRKKHAGGEADDGIDELEDEERGKLERKLRDLEAENFDLRRGVWRDRRKSLQPGLETDANGHNRAEDAFDEIDLSGTPSVARGMKAPPQQHSSFSTVLNSGLAAFRGSAASPAQQSVGGRTRQDSLLQDFDDDAFDEAAFAQAAKEEEAKKMVEHVREVKRKLKDWEGWRLDLVDSRRGGGVGVGEIFEV